MAWLMMSLRRSELQKSINDHTYEKLAISRELRNLSKFANSIGDGQISPNEIASISSGLFGDALAFMEASSTAATETAAQKASDYETAYADATRDQQINAGLALYVDEDGNLNTEALESKFYEEALKEFVQNYIEPQLNEKEQELQDKQTELETLVTSEQAELDQLKNSISQQIQNSAPQLS